MKKELIIAVAAALLASAPAHAISAKYRQQLERSGCTEVSEAQGCDITKTKAQNAKAGFVTEAPAATGRAPASYQQQLERSGCTQVTEAQGCDTTKSKAENAKAGFGTAAPAAATSETPYAGQWVAKGTAGATVATIRIDKKENVWVNGKKVKAKRSDGALVFKDGFITYTIQGDRRLQGEDFWTDSDAGSKGPIHAE